MKGPLRILRLLLSPRGVQSVCRGMEERCRRREEGAGYRACEEFNSDAVGLQAAARSPNCKKAMGRVIIRSSEAQLRTDDLRQGVIIITEG